MLDPKPETRPLYELIYDVLREHLLDESFPQGLVFGETAVARAFGSSRIPAAAALQKLRSEGLLKPFDGRGLIAADSDPEAVLRVELTSAGLRLPIEIAADPKARRHHGRIYPQVEHTVAAALAHGRFLVNETALAEHYGVSRTVAHEVVTKLERIGLVAQEGNQRWYAGPLTVDRLRDHFEMRWLLEPEALGQSMDRLDPAGVQRRREHVMAASSRTVTPLRLEKLETELHVDTVLACHNHELRETVRRNLLPLIATHSTFARTRRDDEIGLMLGDHVEIFGLILAGRKKAAKQALLAHLRRALEPNIERLRQIAPLPDALRPPFLIPADKGD